MVVRKPAHPIPPFRRSGHHVHGSLVSKPDRHPGSPPQTPQASLFRRPYWFLVPSLTTSRLGERDDIDVSGLIGLNLSYLSFFKRCVALRTLKIMLYRGGTISEPISSHVSPLSPFRRLRAVFDALTLPLLKHLHIEDLRKFPIAEITSMITRSQCSLDVLAQSGRDSEAEHCDYDLTTWTSLFDTVPSLLELKFQNIIIPKQILERITKAGLLPQLEVLECRIDTNSLHTFLDTIASRLRTTVSGPSLPVFRRAVGRYLRSSHISDPDYVKSAENRMESLKQWYNSDIQFWACGE
ncbi:hypothetical protein Hypma_003534 [Hypsizygus marmoreus]|uniref:F-box domain-containing protein n=1 Tax=Hypsizygus marmoreus TaxID=39966 RepID=A0A369J8C9_HYPMA|nr:hypothetical protein Hypma_003534 [Hypsizygus marmoreus]